MEMPPVSNRSASYRARIRSFSLSRYADHRDLHSFPTRRSSDLTRNHIDELPAALDHELEGFALWLRDRKSTRLNSSHPSISYAVFCLKKKIRFRTCKGQRGVASSQRER